MVSAYQYIDSHVNLHAPQFAEDRDDVVARAREAGVGPMLNICDRLSNIPAVLDVAQTYDDMWATVGTHPHEARENPELSADDLLKWTGNENIVGIGECGLDFHYDYSPRDVQARVFRSHIIAARESQLPLVVHTREADGETWDILKSEHDNGPFAFLLHCYTSGVDLARKAADIGAYFSVSGIATFKAAESVREVIREMPADRILIETDCPYLAPIPMRGRRNEPAFVRHVYDHLAHIRGWSLEETRQRTHAAFFNLFSKIK